MSYKFERLDVWHGALGYTDAIYDISEQLPESERYNLSSQMKRAANSIALNIAEGSTSQSDAEQVKFLGYAIRSLIETVACLHLVKQRAYLSDVQPLRDAYRQSEVLFKQLQAFRSALRQGDSQAVREEHMTYDSEPFI